MHFQLVPTADGSVSCIDSETGQLYHNRAGAYAEALQNYVQPSLLLDKIQNTGHIRILDACYGMGYNTWALINELAKLDFSASNPEQTPLTLSVVAIEKYPEVLGFLPQVLAHPTFDALKEKITPAEHNTYYRTPGCEFNTKLGGFEHQKIIINVANGLRIEIAFCIDDLRHCVSQLTDDFDVVFHDPFSPQKMPELWTADLFAKYQSLLYRRKGVLLTYSTAAAVRGGLMAAGFQVLKTAGLGDKAGSTLALADGTQANSAFQQISLPLDAWEQDYLQSRAGIPYRDNDLQQPRTAILANREHEQQQSGRPSGGQALQKKPLKARKAADFAN